MVGRAAAAPAAFLAVQRHSPACSRLAEGMCSRAAAASGTRDDSLCVHTISDPCNVTIFLNLQVLFATIRFRFFNINSTDRTCSILRSATQIPMHLLSFPPKVRPQVHPPLSSLAPFLPPFFGHFSHFFRPAYLTHFQQEIFDSFIIHRDPKAASTSKMSEQFSGRLRSPLERASTQASFSSSPLDDDRFPSTASNNNPSYPYPCELSSPLFPPLLFPNFISVPDNRG